MDCPEREAVSADDVVQVWRDGPVAHLRFNRPAALNGIDERLAEGFRQACALVAEDAQVRAVVLSGEGRAFMAGGDLPAMRARPQTIGRDIIAPLHEALKTLAIIDAPVLASVQGAVAGAGVSVMLAADLVIAAENTRLILAYLGIGTSSDGGASMALPRALGLRRALEVALLNEPIDAAKALQWGLVNRVVPLAELAAQTQALAARLAQGPTRAMGRMRRLMRQSFEADFAAHLDAELAAFEACAGEADFAEGLAALAERRTPGFTGSAP